MLPWCITLDNSKGISRLRFWCKNSRVNGINDLPVFMHQGNIYPDVDHAFFNDEREVYNLAAATDAWNRIQDFFRKHIKAS